MKEKKAKSPSGQKFYYDLLKVPMTILDFSSPDRIFIDETFGLRDQPIVKRFNDLLKNGYEIKQFAVVSNTAYFLFERGIV